MIDGSKSFTQSGVGMGRVSHLWVRKISPKNPKIFNLFPLGSKKSHLTINKKYFNIFLAFPTPQFYISSTYYPDLFLKKTPEMQIKEFILES